MRLPNLPAIRVGEQLDANAMWPLLGADEVVVGKVARTMPAAKTAIGYRGPTDAAILFDNQLNVVAVELLDSSDTSEHVAAVMHDQRFFDQFRGWKWGDANIATKIDGVSGATLTSLALAKGVVLRMGGNRPSLVFADPLNPNELGTWVMGEVALDDASGQAIVRDADGQITGRVIRTGPLTDNIAGYQGPTELLVWLGKDDKIVDLRIRRSFDNEPYVGYVRTERSFWKNFKGKTLPELASLDRQAAGVEGVSGATMTSVAVADTLVAAANQAIQLAEQSTATPPSLFASIRWSISDVVTIAVVLLLFVATRLRSFHHRRWRRAWLGLVFVTIGLWTGNLVSLSLIAGWSAEGIAWRLAPGLFVMVAVSLLIPPLTKSNPYCNHLCPHGAIQQWIKPTSRSKRHVKLSPVMTKWLTRIPGATLALAYLSLVIRPVTDLASWEPFHAYLFRIAGWGSIALAIGSLLVAAFVPMGYCRLGCPTGRFLDYLRRSAHSDRVTLADYVAGGLLLFAGVFRHS